MSTIAAPMQDAMPFDFGSDVLVVSAPVYDEQARQADRELCQRYFTGWCGTAFTADGTRVERAETTFADFQAAARRLAEGLGTSAADPGPAANKRLDQTGGDHRVHCHHFRARPRR
ncbi:hypothetical protein [Pseudarthrobacter sp. J47]|uniref:hypothetical protein n=1 Tax=Pseudarthrobacter sp. J47 TaxID=3116482 RepID=UPI002E80D2D1|nr:hypothetical protein [Pseudarthrobacter sp. J47]MEE2524330.1 hypothetical protein [Pseudarthrobacter sp. J47]